MIKSVLKFIDSTFSSNRCLLLIFLTVVSVCTFSLNAFTAQRVALVIGNGDYNSAPLKNPVNDADDMATTLKSLGFEVIHKSNANKSNMLKAINQFGKKLRSSDVGLFYYAGHGLQVKGSNYLIPIGAYVTSETDVEYEGINAGRILGKMETAENNINIIILDACRDNPFKRSFRSSTRGLARMNAPRGTFIAYATSPGSVAADGTGRNGIFTKHLLKNMVTPDLPIERVLKRVRAGVLNDTAQQQMPWQSSSLTGEFYFAGSGSVMDSSPVNLSKVSSKPLMLPEKASSLPPVDQAKQIRRDGRFIAYSNGTVLDTKTGLMWAAKDNGQNINFYNANQYCINYQGGGYKDWRMPTSRELRALYDINQRYKIVEKNCEVHLTSLIELSDSTIWSSSHWMSHVYPFDFAKGGTTKKSKMKSHGNRVLPVRVSE